MRNQYRFTSPPKAWKRVRSDNLTLVPGSALPHQAQWQELANTLPVGAVLIVLPHDNPSQKETLLAVARLLAQGGHQVKVVSSTELSGLSRYVQKKHQ